MQIITKDNALSLAVIAIVLAGLGVAASSHASPSFAPNPNASAYVSAMPEAQALKDRKVQQISVLCEQDRPSSGFHVVYGYWQAGVSKAVNTSQRCDYWSQVFYILPTKAGWLVSTVNTAPMTAYADVMRTVLQASAPTTS